MCLYSCSDLSALAFLSGLSVLVFLQRLKCAGIFFLRVIQIIECSFVTYLFIAYLFIYCMMGVHKKGSDSPF